MHVNYYFNLFSECGKAKKENEQELLEKLRDLDIDLTRYLIHQNPTPVDQQYHILNTVQTVTNKPTTASPSKTEPFQTTF